MNIEELEGVGPHLATIIRKHFGSNEAFLEAARRKDIQALAAIDGISERRAVALVRTINGLDADQRLLATPGSRRIMDNILARLLQFAATETGRNQLRLLHPLPNATSARKHAQQVMDAKQQVANLDRTHIRNLLRRLAAPPLKAGITRFVDERIVVCEDPDTRDRLHKQGAHHWITLTGPRGLREAADHDLVLFLYGDGRIDLGGIHNLIELPGDAGLPDIAPEAIISWFQARLPALEACQELAQLLERSSQIPEVLAALEDLPAPHQEVDVAAAVEQARKHAEEELRTRMAQVQLGGDELLKALTGGAGTTPAPLRAVIESVLVGARQKIHAETGCNMQPFLPGLPIRIDDQEVERVARRERTQAREKTFQARVEAAKQLASLQTVVEDEIQSWLAWDAQFALGCFAHHYDLWPATHSDRLHFTQSIHLDLADTPDAKHIQYEVGGSDNEAARVAILTGANSGGKSTLLEHLAQLVTMARMGLPVVGRDVEVPWVDELHLVTARRGLDAGAFETFLRSFLPVVRGDARRLVLVDEVESVTELEASGRILGFFVDRLAASGSLGVVVTHLAPQILAHASEKRLRVDGIEATGLDEDNELVVDRCPKMGVLARSTPELIVQRLAATTQGAEGQLYEELLEVFRRPMATGSGASVPLVAELLQP